MIKLFSSLTRNRHVLITDEKPNSKIPIAPIPLSEGNVEGGEGKSAVQDKC